MKLLYVVGVLLVLSTVQGSFFSDVFTGLSEAVDDANIKKKFEILGTNVKKVGEEAFKHLKEETPNDDWIEMTKKYLDDIPFKVILEKNSEEKMASLVSKWNNVIQELNKAEKSSKEMFKKIRKDLRSLLPEDRFTEWKKKAHNVAKKIKDVVKKQLKKTDIEVLKKSIKKWMQPSFMENKENVEEEKQMVLDAVAAANKKVREDTEIAHEKVQPLVKLTALKKETDDAESRLESWLEKKFTKPHHASGKSKWALLLKKMPLTSIKSKLKDVPFKKVKKTFKKLAKMNKKFLLVKKPIKTDVKIVNEKRKPIFISREDSDKLEALTPEQRREYEQAEAKWETKMVKETQKLLKKWSKKGIEKKQPVAPTPMMTGNEQWLNEDDDNEDYSFNENDQLSYQQTKPKLKNKQHEDKDIKYENEEWMALGRKVKSMLKGF